MSDEDRCDGRPVIWQRIDDDGEWRPFAFTDKAMTQPEVHTCVHEALDFLEWYLYQSIQISLMHGVIPKPPNQDDYRIVFVDEEPDYLDNPVEDIGQAESLIKNLMKG